MTCLIIKTINNCEIIEPISKKDVDKLVKAGKAKHLEGVIYHSSVPKKKYRTKVQKAE